MNTNYEKSKEVKERTNEKFDENMDRRYKKSLRR